VRWDALDDSETQKLALAQALVPVTARLGWTHAALASAAQSACGDAEAWRALFPRGARDAVWFISEVSDASMRQPFEKRPAVAVADVIRERLEQNAALKPFVFRVMLFDLCRPFQAVARMQRTAHQMRSCLVDGTRAPGATALNWAYTLIVVVWLCDCTRDNRLTLRLNGWMMRAIGG
jgi:hypothetical protein